MPSRISWSNSVVSDDGARVSGRGDIVIDTATGVTATLDPAMGAAEALALQVADPSGVAVLAIFSNIMDGSVTVEGTLGAATALTGPLVLYGAAVSMFATDLTTLSVQNNHATEEATVEILIGRIVAP
ncbi:hypothetical protein Q5Y75_27055 [Ruegeria sp. 2205SS24-7]|uniref:hypothetical protein n=1 Tax=Ruegeria discodermiae TaxID=3064389 RepID=UPI00274050AB|nr:hypothetical protein [Ruegeria sp. 2205SS24-7]MDP5220851.1 hypothetical protein [Ruegeria sp. 2205SS24-7]